MRNRFLTLVVVVTLTTGLNANTCEDISDLIQLKKEVGFKLRGIADRNIGTIAKDTEYFIAMNDAEINYLSEGYNSCINGNDPVLSLTGLDTLDRAEIMEEEEEEELHKR